MVACRPGVEVGKITNTVETSRKYAKAIVDRLEVLQGLKNEAWEELESLEEKTISNIYLDYQKNGRYLVVNIWYGSERNRIYVGDIHSEWAKWERTRKNVERARYLKNYILELTCRQELIDQDLFFTSMKASAK